MINGYALTQITTGTVSWLSCPENFVVLSNWPTCGVHDDVWHLAADPLFDICYSTNIASHLFVSSSAHSPSTFDTVKGTPFISTNGPPTVCLPDGSSISYAAVLHGPMSAIAPESRLWYAASATNYCMTWKNSYALCRTIIGDNNW